MPHSSPFGSLFSRLFHSGPADPPEAAPSDPDRLAAAERTLEGVMKAVQEKTRVEEEQAESVAAALRRPADTRTREEAALDDREAARARLEGDISQLHRRLGTGLVPTDYPVLQKWMRTHAPPLQEPPASLEARIDGHVLGELYERAGRLAWERLEELMEQARQPWPMSPDMLKGRDEDAERILAQHRAEVQQNFMETAPARLADLVTGEVAAWSHYYPDSSSVLWKEVALRGVAAGLRIQLFRSMLDLWSERPPELEAALAAVLESRLQAARKLLEGGVQSLDEARKVTAEVERAYAQVLPDMVWDYLGPQVRRQPNYPGSPALVAAGTTQKIKL